MEFVEHGCEGDLERYTMRTLPTPESDRLEERLLICSACRDRLESTGGGGEDQRERVHRAGGERIESRWGLQRPLWNVGVVMTMITTLTVIAGFYASTEMKRGRTKERSCPKKPTPNGPHSGEGKSQRARNFRMNRNETAFWRVCKLVKIRRPGTESNRPRQPFQGCYLR